MTRFLIALLLLGCGPIPKLRENHSGLAPWESMPTRGGVTFVAKFTHDPGMEPVYAALVEYQTSADLDAIINHFHLIERPSVSKPRSRLRTVKGVPGWAIAPRSDKCFAYRDVGDVFYNFNLWVDTVNHRAVCERAWW